MILRATNWTPDLEPGDVGKRLGRYGHLAPGLVREAREEAGAKIDDYKHPSLTEALVRYQRFFFSELSDKKLLLEGRQIVVDGVYGAATEALLRTERCAFHDQPQEANWPRACREQLKFALLFERLAPLTSTQTKLAFTEALRSWSDRLKVDFLLDDAAGRSAHIWADKGRLSGTTLAWSYLAQDTCATSLEQRYNTAVNWAVRYLQAVAAHELGHAIGYPHTNERGALMYPYARAEIYLPTEIDIRNGVRLGYERRDEPLPDPEPEPDPNDERVIAIRLKRSGAGVIEVDDFGIFDLPEWGGDGGGGTKWSEQTAEVAEVLDRFLERLEDHKS